MKRLFLFTSIVLVMAFYGTSSAKILFYDNCEDMFTASEWTTNGVTGTNTIAVSSTHKKAGSYSYKIHQTACPTGPSSCTGGAQTNCELLLKGLNSPIPLKNFLWDQEYWVGWSTYFASDFPDPVGYGLQGQLHGAIDDRCDNYVHTTLWGLYFDSDAQQHSTCFYQPDACATTGISCPDFGDVSYPLPIIKGAWNDTVMHFKFNYNGSGILQVWRNGVQYVDYAGSFGYNDSPKGHYLKMGLYGWWDEDVDVWIDEFKAGDENSSYNEVAPGSAANISPTVQLLVGGGDAGASQSIAIHGALAFDCSAADSDGSISSYVWDYDDSGILPTSTQTPGSKIFDIEGTYTVRVTVTDNEGATASDYVNVVVGSAPITGLINNWLIESGAIIDDDEGNEDLVNNGTIAIEGSPTEMDPPALGTHGAVLNGTDQYFTLENWDASNPWQSGKKMGTIVLGLKTPSSYPTGAKKYLFNSYDITGDTRVLAIVFNAGDLEPQLLIGVNSGASYELKYFNTTLSTSNRYILFATVDASAKTWYMRVYDAEAEAWLTDSSGGISGTMNLVTTSPWTIGRRSDGATDTCADMTLYFVQVYNTIMTPEEMTQFVGSRFTPPTAPSGTRIK